MELAAWVTLHCYRVRFQASFHCSFLLFSLIVSAYRNDNEVITQTFLGIFLTERKVNICWNTTLSELCPLNIITRRTLYWSVRAVYGTQGYQRWCIVFMICTLQWKMIERITIEIKWNEDCLQLFHSTVRWSVCSLPTVVKGQTPTKT